MIAARMIYVRFWLWNAIFLYPTGTDGACLL